MPGYASSRAVVVRFRNLVKEVFGYDEKQGVLGAQVHETCRGLVGDAQQAMISTRTSNSMVNGQCAVVIAMIVTIVIRRPGTPIYFLHVADPGQQVLQFSRPGRDRTLSTILRPPCLKRGSPADNVFATIKKVE